MAKNIEWSTRPLTVQELAWATSGSIPEVVKLVAARSDGQISVAEIMVMTMPEFEPLMEACADSVTAIATKPALGKLWE